MKARSFIKRNWVEKGIVALLFVLALVLFYFADKGSQQFKDYYKKQTNIEVK